ncbi:MAG: hypothetical protein US66_C0030G0006 [Candidatus Moranbacteria bacterium GW2011_GWD2_37_9]|nr:MAG: hypothetical protein US16_C0048G0006 [Candidatus Moranbacteria bacterium GW2011_GWE2_36_40]KKQ46718.1 MAG: hypothetical protein US66_C0030G0006 [Candidatus Moranbacteria bacterium GW2011_GWD2_37_9]
MGKLPNACFLYTLNEDGTLLHSRFLDPKENCITAFNEYAEDISIKYGWKKSPIFIFCALKTKTIRESLKIFSSIMT